jgi:16S rRNA (guanine527-N7)-methyltransferase
VSFEEDLRLVLGDEGPDLPHGTLQKLESLDRILVRWSARIGLIGFRTEAERIRRYFGEAVAAAKRLPRTGRALDIGSGGGTPGLPFAIAKPELSWRFLEPRRRRRLFLEEAVRELGLENVEVSDERFEPHARFAEAESLEAISCRGVRLREKNLDAVGSALSYGGRFLLWSGEERAPEIVAWVSLRSGLAVEGPLALVADSPARLLVVTRVG